ncbi:hypothetical protein Vafri_13874 [Volvox africanus]|uniref:Uncharacterized protein n=1 Tax=Volvox africanus TaxID=51714 RepID=A0A8J4BEU3_9CHLO|nr:hypothetical protein Vafri_13874 [Volvox africanus]
MLEEMQQGGRPGGARRRRASMGISLAVSSETGFQEGCSLGLLFAPSTHFTGGGVGDSGDVEMEVFEDAGAPFQFDLEEVEIERLRAVPASEASGGAADLAALLGGELSAGGRTRGGASIVGDDEDTRSGSPSSGLTVAASRERESGGVDRRRSTATAATMAAGGRGAVKTSEPLLGELLPDLSLGAGAGDLDLAMDLGISDEQVEGDDGGGATTPSKAPGVSGTRQRAAVSAGDAATGAGAADAATASALHTGTAAVAAVSRGVSFTAEDIRATMEAADRAAASMDPYDVLPDADVNVVGHEGAAPADSRLSGPSQDDDVAPQDRLPRRDGTEQAEQRAATPPPVYHDHDGIDAMEVDVDGGGAAAAPPTGGAMHAARTVSGAASLHVNVGAVQRSASQRTMGNVEAEAGLGVDAGNSQARDAAGVHSLGPAPSASYGATGGPPSSAGGQAAGSNSALRTGGSIMSTGAAMIGGSGGGGGGGSAATASIDGGAGATVPNEEEQAPAAVPVAPLPRMLTRRAAAAVAAAEATAAAALPIEPAATAAAAKANAAEDQGALEDQQSSPPQERAPMGRRRGARVVAGRSITLDEEGLTLKTAHLREWIQDRSGILDQTRLMKLSSSTGAEPAAHHPRHHQQTAKRRRVATDGSFVALMHARAESDMEGVMRSGQEVLNSAEPAAVGSWQPLMQDPAPAVRSDVGRRLPRQRSVRAAAPLAPSIQALFRVAVGQMAPQYALQMGAAAAAGPMGRARAPSGAGGGAPSDAGGAAVCPAPSWRMTPAGLAGAGTPTRGVGTTAGVPAPSANTMGVGGTGVNVTRGTPSTQRHGVSPAQGLVGNASAGAAMPMQVFSGATAGGSRGGVTASGALPGGSLGRRSDGDVRGMEGGDDDVGQGVEEQARAGTPVERLGSALGGAAARTSAGGASRQGLALRDEGPAGSGRQLRVVLFPARDEEDEAAQMMEDVRERENEDANLADGLQMGLAHASAAVAAAAAAAATSEVSLGHTESDKENNPVDLNEDAGKEDLPPRQGTVGTSAHRQPLGLQQQTQQYLSTPSRATGGITPAASAGRMQGPGGRASAAAGAASGASAAAAEEGPWGPRQEGVWGLDPGYGGGAVAEAMDVDGEGRNAALEAEQGLAGGVDMNLGAADLAHGQIRSRGSQRTSAASAPSAQQAAEGSGGANAADAGAQRPVPQLATPLGSRRKVPGSAMRLRSQTRSQPSALQGGQQHDAGGPVAGTPLGVGTGGAGDESMSHSEGLGLGSMLQRRQRPRFIDDDGVDSGGGEAGAGGSGGGYSGYSPGALSAGRTASQHGTGSQGRLCRSNLHSIQEEVQEGGTPVHLAAAGPGSGAAQPVSDGRLTNIDPRTTGALRTALATGSGLMSDADWSREQDESLATRTLQEFDLVARAAAVAAVAAAGIGSAQPGLVTEAAGTSQQVGLNQLCVGVGWGRLDEGRKGLLGTSGITAGRPMRTLCRGIGNVGSGP